MWTEFWQDIDLDSIYIPFTINKIRFLKARQDQTNQYMPRKLPAYAIGPTGGWGYINCKLPQHRIE